MAQPRSGVLGTIALDDYNSAAYWRVMDGGDGPDPIPNGKKNALLLLAAFGVIIVIGLVALLFQL
jgi:hypothetical protein